MVYTGNYCNYGYILGDYRPRRRDFMVFMENIFCFIQSPKVSKSKNQKIKKSKPKPKLSPKAPDSKRPRPRRRPEKAVHGVHGVQGA